jgi:hypothetical protein
VIARPDIAEQMERLGGMLNLAPHVVSSSSSSRQNSTNAAVSLAECSSPRNMENESILRGSRMMDGLSRSRSLLPNDVDRGGESGKAIVMSHCTDIEVHRGTDGKYYLLDVARYANGVVFFIRL